MDTDFLLRKEHEEYAKRIDAENNRQNKRIEILEDEVKQINALTTSVERMAVNMENMVKELGKQGDRLENLEKEPVETSKHIRRTIIASVISAVVTAVVSAIIVLL